MVWVRIDDHFDEHPKVAQLDDHAFALFVCGLTYCNRNLTDGFIPSMVGHGQLRFCDGNPVPAIRQLENVGMWVKVPGGWQVHDFPQYQPSKEAVLKERSEAAKRQAKLRNTRSNARSNAVTSAVTSPVTNSVTHGVSHGVSHAPVTGYPVPGTGVPEIKDVAAAVSPGSVRARARGEAGFQPMSTLIDKQRRQRRQQTIDDLPEEVRERLARPPIAGA